MKRIRFSEEQTLWCCASTRQVRRQPIWRTSMGSRKPRCTTGRPSMAASTSWRPLGGQLNLNLHASAIDWFRLTDDQSQCLEAIEPIGHAGATEHRRLRQLARRQSIGIARSAKSASKMPRARPCFAIRISMTGEVKKYARASAPNNAIGLGSRSGFSRCRCAMMVAMGSCSVGRFGFCTGEDRSVGGS